MVKLEVRKNTYYDSVTLMIISKDVKNLPGITEALVGMGTDLNREIAGNLGLDTEGFEEVTANDFFVAAKCDDEDCFKKAVEKVDELLNKKAEKSKRCNGILCDLSDRPFGDHISRSAVFIMN